jgi:hypothetical protein
MNEKQRKITAAIAAVMQYLQEEVELAALEAVPAAAAEPAPVGPKLWALHGRQTQMQLRNLMQLRSLGR